MSGGTSHDTAGSGTVMFSWSLGLTEVTWSLFSFQKEGKERGCVGSREVVINGDTDTQTGRVTFPGACGSQSPGQPNTEGCAQPWSHLFSLKIPTPLLSFLLVWQLLMGSNEFVYFCSLDIYSTNCIPRDIPPAPTPPAFQPSETWGRTQFQSKPCSSVSSYDQQRKANPAIFLGFSMKIKAILEMAFPHCIVRSFHYARASLPASVTGPRDGLCALGAGLPTWSYPASGDVPACLLRRGHTSRAHVPRAPQPR